MHLLNTNTLKIHTFYDSDTPLYAILSHTWGDDEVTYEQFISGSYENLAGYDKIRGCCSIAAQDGWDWVWIDTCCIDKRSSAELSEAINSMYSWYSRAEVCYAYLEDVFQAITLDGAVTSAKVRKRGIASDGLFGESRWFTRGWTLQELLAPQSVTFYDRHWTEIGTKSNLLFEVSQATGIAHEFLESPHNASVAQKMSWASNRQTTRPEDIAYCLLGLFDVNMPLLYGEGLKAFKRLQEEIIKLSADQSIFAWSDSHCKPQNSRFAEVTCSGMLAWSPECFSASSDIITARLNIDLKPYSITHLGLSMEFQYVRKEVHDRVGLRSSCSIVAFDDGFVLMALLACAPTQATSTRCAVPLAVTNDIGPAEKRASRISRPCLDFDSYETDQDYDKARFYIASLCSHSLGQRPCPNYLRYSVLRFPTLISQGWYVKGDYTGTAPVQVDPNREIITDLYHGSKAIIEYGYTFICHQRSG